jgi:beta-barrel assembly-enhancing protease
MRRALAFAAVLLVAAGALYFAQRRTGPESVSPNAVVDVLADLQRDVSRAPMLVSRISDDEETRIGDELASQYEAQQPAQSAETKALERYVRQVGGRVAAHAKRKLAYRFHLVQGTAFINAFALPGGHIFIGQGLLDQLTSEDELAFVLGHELEHVDHYHAAERVQIEAQLKHLNLDVVAAIAQIPISIWQTGYSKDQEFEADREGLRAAVAGGYSALGAVKLLEKFTKLDREYVIHAETPTDELSQLTIDGLMGYFRSHPFSSERLAQAKTVIAQDRLPTDQPLKPFHLEYEITSGERQADRATR